MKSCAKNKLYGFQYPLSGSLYFYTWQVHTEEGEELYNQKSILRIFKESEELYNQKSILRIFGNHYMVPMHPL